MPDEDRRIVVALLGGGAMGAVIKIIYDVITSRIPRVGRRIDILPVFVPRHEGAEPKATITLTHDGAVAEYRNLYIAELAVENRGRIDFPDFQFMVELLGGDVCVFLAKQDADRSHRLDVLEPVAPGQPSPTLKLALRPFNRGDRYQAKLYLVIPEGAEDPSEPRFSSSHAVRFVDMPTVGEMVAEAAAGTALKIGPFVVGVRR